jgi:hypothetical protein
MAAGRPKKTVELLATLIEWAGGADEFRRLTGIRKGDQNHYLASTKNIRTKRLHRAAHQIFGTPPAFLPLVERAPVAATLPATLNKKPGVYALFSSSGSLLYFGKATNLRFEIGQTLSRLTPKTLVGGTKVKKVTFRDVAALYSAYEVARGDSSFRHDAETLVLRVARRDTLNTVGGHFTRKA